MSGHNTNNALKRSLVRAQTHGQMHRTVRSKTATKEQMRRELEEAVKRYTGPVTKLPAQSQ